MNIRSIEIIFERPNLDTCHLKIIFISKSVYNSFVIIR